MKLPVYIQLLVEENVLTLEQISAANKVALKERVHTEYTLVSLGFLSRKQLVDAIDRAMMCDSDDVKDTTSGVLRLRKEIQALTGVIRLTRTTGTGDALNQPLGEEHE